MKKLILFDIDGTLIRGSKAHHDSFSAAFKKVFGVDIEIEGINPAGKTDRRIIFEALKKKGIKRKDIEKNFNKIRKVMVDYFKRNLKHDPYLKLIPNSKKLVRELAKGNILGIITGNLREIAELKLKKVGLLKYFKVIGSGENSENRNYVLKKTIELAEKKFKTKFSKDQIFIIGDTPKDIEGKKFGRVIAVCTGPYKHKILKKYKPDFIFKDFSRIDRILEILKA